MAVIQACRYFDPATPQTRSAAFFIKVKPDITCFIISFTDLAPRKTKSLGGDKLPVSAPTCNLHRA